MTTPQEKSIEIARRLYAIDALGQALLWCAFVMNSRDQLGEVLDLGILSADDLEKHGYPGGAVRICLERLRAAVADDNEIDWANVQREARNLLELLRKDSVGIPEASSRFGDIFSE
jgi:hypothetical protein